MKNNLVRFFNTYVDCDMLSMSSRPEWLPCLHNICLLHGAIRLRSKLPINVGWQDPHAFDDVNITHLKVSSLLYLFDSHRIFNNFFSHVMHSWL